jgi:hypothetical protein
MIAAKGSRMVAVTAALVLLACDAGVARAQAKLSAAARARAFATLPDWRGMWQSAAWLPLGVSGRPAGGEQQLKQTMQLVRHPPYNPEWNGHYESALENASAVAAAAATLKGCTRSFPALMEAPWIFQVSVLPEETLLVFENGQVRHVYTDVRSHPTGDDLWPTPLGDSIGHWEGDTLVVDTIARTAGDLGPRATFAKLSERAHFIERLRRVDINTLEDRMTIEDPVAFAQPWQLRFVFKRQPEMTRMIPTDCAENDRNPVIDGKMTITAP